MPSIEKVLTAMRANPRNVRYADLRKCASATSARRAPLAAPTRCFAPHWPGDPRVNIQNDQGKAKPYQVRQVLTAIQKKEATDADRSPH